MDLSVMNSLDESSPRTSWEAVMFRPWSIFGESIVYRYRLSISWHVFQLLPL